MVNRKHGRDLRWVSWSCRTDPLAESRAAGGLHWIDVAAYPYGFGHSPRRVRCILRRFLPRSSGELYWLGGLLAASALILVFGHLAEEVLEGDTSAFDHNIRLFFRDPADTNRLLGPYWLPEVVRDLTSLGSTVVLALL